METKGRWYGGDKRQVIASASAIVLEADIKCIIPAVSASPLNESLLKEKSPGRGKSCEPVTAECALEIWS